MLAQMRAVQVEGSATGPVMTRVRQSVIPVAEPVTLGSPGWAASPAGVSEMPEIKFSVYDFRKEVVSSAGRVIVRERRWSFQITSRLIGQIGSIVRRLLNP